MNDAQWALVEPLLPAPNKGERPEKHPRTGGRDLVCGAYRLGCSWRQLPVDFPPWQTVYWYFTRCEENKAAERMLVVLRRRVRAGSRGGTPSCPGR
ncbi:transposase [Micromonospora sp. CB01531]|uniref:transposase n=1 Tax=Micromonospora sp. CB01531 TaxID=1718947 RepID=UPI003FD3C7D1